MSSSVVAEKIISPKLKVRIIWLSNYNDIRMSSLKMYAYKLSTHNQRSNYAELCDVYYNINRFNISDYKNKATYLMFDSTMFSIALCDKLNEFQQLKPYTSELVEMLMLKVEEYAERDK